MIKFMPARCVRLNTMHTSRSRYFPRWLSCSIAKPEQGFIWGLIYFETKSLNDNLQRNGGVLYLE